MTRSERFAVADVAARLRTTMQNAMMIAGVEGVAIQVEVLSDGVALVCERHIADGVGRLSRRVVSARRWWTQPAEDLDELLTAIAGAFLRDCMADSA